jgi:hypothetical protein
LKTPFVTAGLQFGEIDTEYRKAAQELNVTFVVAPRYLNHDSGKRLRIN